MMKSGSARLAVFRAPLDQRFGSAQCRCYNFENVFSFSYSLANLGCMAFAVRYAHLPVFNIGSTVAFPQIVPAGIFAATTALVLDDGIGGQNLFYITTAFVLVAGATAALIQAGIFGLAGRFPSVYTQAVMSGQGVAGMTVSIISLASSLAGSCGGASASPTWKQIQPASFNYFLSSTVVILLTLLVHGRRAQAGRRCVRRHGRKGQLCKGQAHPEAGRGVRFHREF